MFGQNTFLEVSSTYFHMHWPSTFADEFYALPADQQPPTTSELTTGIYIDGPEPTGQRFRDAYRHQTNIGMTRYIDGFLGASHQLKTGFENWYGWGRRLRDLRRHAATVPERREWRCCSPRRCSLYNTPLSQETQMRNFAAFVQDRAQLRARDPEPRPALVVLRRLSPSRRRRRRWFPVTTYPKIDAGFNWSTLAPRTAASGSSPKTAGTSPRRATAATTK